MIDGHDSQRFKSIVAGSAVTIKVQSATGYLFGIPTARRIRVVDTPGLGDAGLNLKQVLQDIKDAIGGNTIDAVVIPIMAN